jgi:hypothetical protein
MQQIYIFASGLLSKSPSDLHLEGVTDGIGIVAMSLAATLFLMDFFQKTLDFEWVKWENVLVLCMKCVFVKWIVGHTNYFMELMSGAFGQFAASVSGGNATVFANEGDNLTYAFLGGEVAAHILEFDPGILNGNILLRYLYLLPSFFIIYLALLGVVLMIVSRFLELIVYTMLAPIPLATFASSHTAEIGKSFLKNYVAVILQAFVIAVMFLSYQTLIEFMMGTGTESKLTLQDGLGVVLASFALFGAVKKSDDWAKKVCGAM